MTAEQFFRLPDEPCRRDLVEGEVWTMAAAGAEHGAIGARLIRRLGNYVEAHRLGETFSAETGFTLERNPDTVLAPDLAFVRAERLPETGIPSDFWELAPDLVVEIVSPNDRAGQVAKKVSKWLQAGVLLVWVVYPRKRYVVVHEPGAPPRTLGDGDTLDGGTVLPGFSCPIKELWSWRPM
jgi:Uma2 family endonuclease